MSLYFNENDRYAAAWLRNLWSDAVVDDRSIVDVQADDVRHLRRCHFFGGIGGWEHALHLAGWPINWSVWTGSCPCQPFSQAGRRRGHADPRHLWPEFRRLVAECHPPVVLGEQVASPAGRDWLAGVRVDLEAMGYAVGAADLCVAGVGAPHIRQRLYWVGHALGAGRQGCGAGVRGGPVDRPGGGSSGPPGGGPGGVGDAEFGVGDRVHERGEPGHLAADVGGYGSWVLPGAASGEAVDFWSRFDLFHCSDGKSRRVEPGLECLVDGVPFRLADGRTAPGASRVAILRGLGNAVVPQVAAVFVRAFLDTLLDEA